MSKCENVLVFLYCEKKKSTLILQAATIWEASQPHGPLGTQVLRKEGNKTSVFGGLQGGLGFSSIPLFEQSPRYHQWTKTVHYHLQDQAPQDNGLLKTKNHYAKRNKIKRQSQTPEKPALDNSHNWSFCFPQHQSMYLGLSNITLCKQPQQWGHTYIKHCGKTNQNYFSLVLSCRQILLNLCSKTKTIKE